MAATNNFRSELEALLAASGLPTNTDLSQGWITQTPYYQMGGVQDRQWVNNAEGMGGDNSLSPEAFNARYKQVGRRDPSDWRTNYTYLVDTQNNNQILGGESAYDAPFDFMKDFALPALAVWGGGALLGGAFGGAGLGVGAGAGAGETAALGLDQVAALGGAGGVGGGAGAGAAIGNGAFLGEGVASGIGAWDSAAGLSALGGGAAAGGGSFSPSMNYGPGMSGVETSIYDKTLGLTGSKGIADAAATVLGPAGNLMPSMPGPSSSWLNLIQGGLGLIQSNKLSQLGNPTEANQLAQAQLAALLKDPSSVTKLPGYEAGLEAVQRTGAAQGYTGSGNMMLALQKYGGDFYNSTLNTLNSLGQAGAPIQQGYKMGSTELLGNALNNLSYGATKLFGWGG